MRVCEQAHAYTPRPHARAHRHTQAYTEKRATFKLNSMISFNQTNEKDLLQIIPDSLISYPRASFVEHKSRDILRDFDTWQRGATYKHEIRRSRHFNKLLVWWYGIMSHKFHSNRQCDAWQDARQNSHGFNMFYVPCTTVFQASWMKVHIS